MERLAARPSPMSRPCRGQTDTALPVRTGAGTEARAGLAGADVSELIAGLRYVVRPWPAGERRRQAPEGKTSSVDLVVIKEWVSRLVSLSGERI